MNPSLLYHFNSIFKKVLILILLIPFILVLSSCKQYTKYERPQVSVPSEYRGSLTDIKSSQQTFGELYWGDILQDDTLKEIIKTALASNYDIRIAAEKIFESAEKFNIALANRYPFINSEALHQSQKLSHNSSTPIAPGYPDITRTNQLDFNLSFELDFWGKLKRASDAAKADLLATEEAKNTVLMTLVSEVTSGYFQLRELDLELDISQKTMKSRIESYNLVKTREEAGIATMLDVDQSKSLVLNSQIAITNVQQRIQQQENYISFLLGKNPGEIPRGKPLSEQIAGQPVPPGLPSSLLINRPDIRQAEQVLIAAGAKIDMVRAALFPQVTLTALDGTLSKNVSNLFTDPNAIWNIYPKLNLPIFNSGQLKSQVKVTESQKRQAVIQYEKTVQGAFREVSDSLIGYEQQKIYTKQQKELVETLKDQTRLSNMRYIGGVTSYLEVLDTERQYFESEIQLAQAQLNELLYLIKLYKALGGGWKQE